MQSGRCGDLGHFPCHSEGAERLKNMGCVRGIRDCHVEFTPSRVRFFAALSCANRKKAPI